MQDSGLRLPRSLDQGCQIPVPGPLFQCSSTKLEAQLSSLLSPQAPAEMRSPSLSGPLAFRNPGPRGFRHRRSLDHRRHHPFACPKDQRLRGHAVVIAPAAGPMMNSVHWKTKLPRWYWASHLLRRMRPPLQLRPRARRCCFRRPVQAKTASSQASSFVSPPAGRASFGQEVWPLK